MYVIGRGRYAGETYPSPPNAAVVASRNRNVAVPQNMSVPFTPTGGIIAALLYTPKVSGVVQVTALLDIVNGAVSDTYVMVVGIVPGTGLSVTGGEFSSNGWVVGSNTPPVVGGVLGAPQILGISTGAIAGNGQGDLDIAAAISQPLPVGVPVVIEVLLNELGGGHSIATLVFSSLSILELP